MSDLPTLEIDREAFAIVATVADHHGIAPRILLGDNRTRRISDLRKQACYLMRRILGLSLSDIGRALGGMDHSSVKYAIGQAEVSYDADPGYAREIDALRAIATKTISDFRRHPLPEGGETRRVEPLEVAKRVMRSPRGEIHLSGSEMRILAEAYLDMLLQRLGKAT